MTEAAPHPAIGYKIRQRRKSLGLTQAEMADSLGISAPYLNLMESNKRRVSAALLPQMAHVLAVDIEDLTGTAERRLMDDLEELAADALFQGMELEPEFTAEAVGRYPNWTQAILRLGTGFRENQQANTLLSDRLNRDPALGAAVHRMLTYITAIRSASEILEGNVELGVEQRRRFRRIIMSESERLSDVAQQLVSAIGSETNEAGFASAVDQVDDFIVRFNNYFPLLESLADDVSASFENPESLEVALTDVLAMDFDVRVVTADHSRIPRERLARGSAFDDKTSTLYIDRNVGAATRRFQIARVYAERSHRRVIEDLVDAPELSSDIARQRASTYLSSYVASAMLFPYTVFLSEAETCRYDIDALVRRFDASFEQIAHRLVTLRKPGEEGIPFAFLRSDPAGFVTKRFPMPGLALPRHGNACPRWAIYQAPQTPARIVRQVAEFPNGDRYLFIARTVRKKPLRFHDPDFLHSIMLMCDVLHADKTVYADGLDLNARHLATQVGPSCRLCTRFDCDHREEPPVFSSKKGAPI